MSRTGSPGPVGPPARARPLGVAAGVLACLVPLAGQCVTWDYVPSLSAGALYESNPRGASDSDLEDDAYAGSASASVEITGETQTSSIYFRPRAQGAAYTGARNASDLNYFDYFLPLGLRWTSQLMEFGVGAEYSKISTRNFPNSDPNEDPGVNPAQPRTDEYMERWSLSPSMSWQVAPQDILSFSLGYDDVSFTEAQFTRRSDYQSVYGDATWSHSLAPRHRVSVTATINAFFAEIPGTLTENDSVSYGGYLGYEYLWAEGITVGGTAGSARSDITVKGLPFISTPFGPLPCLDPVQNVFVPCELKTDDRNFVGQIYLRQQAAETITTQFSLARSIQPNSDGAQVTLDALSGYVRKEFTPLLSGSLGGNYSKQKAVGADNVGGAIGQRFSREYWNVEASLGWRLTRTWEIRTDYAFYQDEQTEGILYKVPRHRFNVYVQYQGLGSH